MKNPKFSRFKYTLKGLWLWIKHLGIFASTYDKDADKLFLELLEKHTWQGSKLPTYKLQLGDATLWVANYPYACFQFDVKKILTCATVYGCSFTQAVGDNFSKTRRPSLAAIVYGRERIAYDLPKLFPHIYTSSKLTTKDYKTT